jgi:hypothetical protein
MPNLMLTKSIVLGWPRFEVASVSSHVQMRSIQPARKTMLTLIISKSTDKKLTQAKLQQAAINRKVKVQHSDLVLAAQTLLSCSTCAKEVADEACSHLESAHVNEGFESIFAIREAVLLSIARVSQSSMESNGAFECNQQNHDRGAELQTAALPWPERAVFLMRDVLHYSRRETALLLRMTDAQIDQLTSFARIRIASINNNSVISLQEWYRERLVQPLSVSTADPRNMSRIVYKRDTL